MVSSKSTTREERAAALIREGRVRLHPGKGIATVAGSKGETYTVTKTSCTCPDFTARGLDCKHRIAARQLCAEYRAAAAQARNGETVRPSVGLLRALGWLAETPAPAPVAVPTGALVDRTGVPYCGKCGADVVNGLCSGRHVRRLEAELFGPEAA